jgi:crotonobetainyl-CoA:carnitine CoA-transferase CaiB-like acyl-CoA transferase
MSGPLAGLRVVDLTQVLSGPFCTMLLADLGADVIKVEPPTGDVARLWGPHVPPPDDSPAPRDEVTSYGGYFASVNRNKRSVCLDLKSADGRGTLLELLAGADVLVENFRVGVMDRFGLSYEELHARFPALVYASIRGFGDPRTGPSPYLDWPAFDIIAQAMGGLMGVTGVDAEHPVKVGPGVGDIFPAVLAAFGVLAAVRHAHATGMGQLVDVAMYDSVLALSERIVYQHSITGTAPAPQGNTHPLLCPYGLVRTADGFVTVATPSDHHWRLLTGIIGRPELGGDARFATNAARLASSAEVYGLVEAWSRERSTAAVVSELAGRIPCGPVNTAADIAADPHVAARDMIVQVDHPSGRSIQVAGIPVKLTGTPATRVVRAPLLGEHTAEVLEEMGRIRARGAEPAIEGRTRPTGDPGGDRR